MRPSLRALAAYGALVATLLLSPAMAQSDTAAQAGGAPQIGGSAQTGADAAGASPVVPARDLKEALAAIRASWRNYARCEERKICETSLDSLGVGVMFSDGSIAPFTRVQRLTASEHDCIVKARAALAHGDRGLAVQWVMAAKLQMSSPVVRNWLGDHPDAVVQALRRNDCCF